MRKLVKYLLTIFAASIVVSIVLAVILAFVVPAHEPISTSSSTTDTTVNTAHNGAMFAWASAVYPAWQKIGTDLTSIGTDGNNGDVNAVGADCSALEGDAANAQALNPAPDSNVEATWSQILSGLQVAAADCITGVDENDASLIQQATAQFYQAAGAITAFTNQLNSYGS